MIAADMPDEVLAAMWRKVDWQRAEQRLAQLQRRLAEAAHARDWNAVASLQDELVHDFSARCLAVQSVSMRRSGPGIDGVRWTTDAQRMAAVAALVPEGYHAQANRRIVIRARNTGRQRCTNLPTYHDRAMLKLYAYALAPVEEAHSDRKSFGFRKGRSALDAETHAMRLFVGPDAPHIYLKMDIKTFYATIQHDWLLHHVPMDRHVLSEFLGAGYVFASQLFPSDGQGISEGSALSPILANFVLNGLQARIYRAVHGSADPGKDRFNGQMVRFADDVVVACRTYADAHAAQATAAAFLADRGCCLNDEKTHIGHIDDGFDFLSRTIQRVGGHMTTRPSDAAVERFTAELAEVVMGWRKSPRTLIQTVNSRLRGWANYHRHGECQPAFRQVDNRVTTAFVAKCLKEHHGISLSAMKERFFYRVERGVWVYALETDKSLRVMRISEMPVVKRKPVRTGSIPYLDDDYATARERERDIANVSEGWRGVWKRQEGRCHYCGAPMLEDQTYIAVGLDGGPAKGPEESAYIHLACAFDDFEMAQVDDMCRINPYNLVEVVQDILDGTYDIQLDEMGKHWRWAPLAVRLARTDKQELTFTFAGIEKMCNTTLPPTAFKSRPWWNQGSKGGMQGIARAWASQGFKVKRLDLEARRLTLAREREREEFYTPPEWLTRQRVCGNALYEIDQHMAYIRKKYGY